MKRILLTGGGTAGHVTPNIALLSGLRERNYEIHYAGTCTGIEYELIKREKILFHCLSAGKLRRYFDLKNLTDLFKILAGFIQSLFLIIRIRPNIIFSKGGFVSCPVVWAAWILRRPVIIHESDITPGLANRLSMPFARRICYSFPETAPHISGKKGVQTGLPIRQTLFEGNASEGRRICNFNNDKPNLLVIGGSLGSQKINTVIHESLSSLAEKFNVCHICGKGNLSNNYEGYKQFEYVDTELSHLFAMTDIVVSRSGATTLFELLALRIPALLIPLAANASRGDQILNARSFERQGFSRVLLQENLTSETLVSSLNTVLDNRKEMIEAMERSPISNGVLAVLKEIDANVKKGHR